jgi:uracil-DNA glycosylase
MVSIKMLEWDEGPSENIAEIFRQAPLNEYKSKPNRFRLDWGTIYYRGRTDGSARVLIIGQDPAADENVARRVLVGTAGQRVQGLFSKLGITKSYFMINSTVYSIYGQFDDEMIEFMNIETVKNWRNTLLDMLATANLEAIVTFGRAAKYVLDSWPGSDLYKQQDRVFNLVHPTARPASLITNNWNTFLQQLSEKITPDNDGTVNLTPYSSNFKKSDLTRIPLFDFGFGAPAWMGKGNMAIRLNRNRPLPDIVSRRPAIIWVAVEDEG